MSLGRDPLPRWQLFIYRCNPATARTHPASGNMRFDLRVSPIRSASKKADEGRQTRGSRSASLPPRAN